jgi:hypothetical protein
MEDENMYEAIDRDITRSMLSDAKQCNPRKMHTEPWSPAIGLATNTSWYWDVRIKHKGDRKPMAGVLNYYLSLSNVEVDDHNKPPSLEDCIKQINQSRQKLKDVVANAKEHRTQFEVELATAIVEHKHPYLCDGNEYDPVDKDNLVAKVLKPRENQKTAKRSWKKLGRQIRGTIKPETLKWSRLTKIELPDGDEWKKVEDKELMEEHLMERNIEQFLHAGNTPFGYLDFGAKLGHTWDSQMANDTLDSTLQHECLSNEAIRAILNQLRAHPNGKTNMEANRDSRRLYLLYLMRTRNDSIVVFRPIGTTLQSVISDKRGRNRWITGFGLCIHDDGALGRILLSGEMEEGRRCNVGKDCGGYMH